MNSLDPSLRVYLQRRGATTEMAGLSAFPRPRSPVSGRNLALFEILGLPPIIDKPVTPGSLQKRMKDFDVSRQLIVLG